MPAPDTQGGWTTRPLSTAEAGAWARELLKSMGNSAEDAGAHSCKITLLLWLAKFGIDEQVRLTLGYHVGRSSDTMLHYSRDALSGPLRTLNTVISAVIHGKFRPDVSRSGYFVPKPIVAPNSPQLEPNPKRSRTLLLPTPKVKVAPSVLSGGGENLDVGFDGYEGEGEELLEVGCDDEDQEKVEEATRELSVDEVHDRIDGSANGDSEVSSSSGSDTSGSDSDIAVETVAAGICAESDVVVGKRPAKFAGSNLFVHLRLGTLHVAKQHSETHLACGRIIHVGYRCVDNPKFGWSNCKICFGS